MHLLGLFDVLVKRRSIGAAVSCYLRLNAFASLGSCHACYHPCYIPCLFFFSFIFSLSLFSAYSAYFYGSSDQDWHSSIGVEYVTPRHSAHAEGQW